MHECVGRRPAFLGLNGAARNASQSDEVLIHLLAREVIRYADMCFIESHEMAFSGSPKPSQAAIQVVPWHRFRWVREATIWWFPFVFEQHTRPASTRTPLTDTRKFIRRLTLTEIDPSVFAGGRGGKALLVERQCDPRLRSPPQRQQHRRNQQESTERQPHPSLGQAAGKRDSSGDRGHSAKRKR